MKCCHGCGAEWVSEKRQPGVKEYCENCSAYLHACLNCRFHKPSAHNQCAIPNTDWAGGRGGCNFCDEFEFKDANADTNADTNASNKQSQARNALDALLGGDEDQNERPTLFDDLFGG